MAPKYSIIIPAYNEEKRIEKTLRGLISVFKNDYEIIVVFDGDDGTGNIAQKYAQQGVSLIANGKKRQGKGYAILRGFKAASGEIVGFADADGSVEPNDVKRVFDSLTGCDFAIATRRARQSIILVMQSPARRFSSAAFNLIVRILFGIDTKDTQCGCKAFKKQALKKIIGELKTSGFEFDVELLYVSKIRGLKMAEVPVTWAHDRGSTFGLFGESPKMLLRLIELRLGV